MGSRSRVFCSYAHEDASHFITLSEHLASLRRTGHIELWSDRDIPAGADWAESISDSLEDADVVLMLISRSYIASDYIFGIEMKRTLELAEVKQAVAMPILVRDCDWEPMPFARLQMMPNDRDPITPIARRPDNEQDEAWSYVVRSLRALLETHTVAVAGDPSDVRGAQTDAAAVSLVLRFLRTWDRWGFNIARIRKWGSRQPGFGGLKSMKPDVLKAELEGLVAEGRVKTFRSKSGTALYRAVVA